MCVVHTLIPLWEDLRLQCGKQQEEKPVGEGRRLQGDVAEIPGPRTVQWTTEVEEPVGLRAGSRAPACDPQNPLCSHTGCINDPETGCLHVCLLAPSPWSPAGHEVGAPRTGELLPPTPSLVKDAVCRPLGRGFQELWARGL